MSQSEVLQLIGLVKARYGPKFQHNPAMEQMWNMVLDDVPLDAAKPVLADWFKTEDWPPDPAHIRNTVLNIASGLPTPADAWLMVLHRMKNTYPGMPAEKWDAPKEVQDALKDIGGMHLLRQIEKAEDARKRYEQAYARRIDSARQTTPALGPHVMKELIG